MITMLFLMTEELQGKPGSWSLPPLWKRSVKIFALRRIMMGTDAWEKGIGLVESGPRYVHRTDHPRTFPGLVP